MLILTGPFRLICLAVEVDDMWEGRWRLERIEPPGVLMSEAACAQAEASEFAAKQSALKAGLIMLEQNLKFEAEGSQRTPAKLAL